MRIAARRSAILNPFVDGGDTRPEPVERPERVENPPPHFHTNLEAKKKEEPSLFVGHGVEELSEKDRREWLEAKERVRNNPPEPSPERRVVRVSNPDYLGRGLTAALEREAETNPQYRQLVERVLKMGEHIGKSDAMWDRSHPDRRPQDIILGENEDG